MSPSVYVVMCACVAVFGGRGYCMQVCKWNIIITHNFMYDKCCMYLIIMSTSLLTSPLIIVETFL